MHEGPLERKNTSKLVSLRFPVGSHRRRGAFAAIFVLFVPLVVGNLALPRYRRAKDTPPGNGESHAPKRCASSASIEPESGSFETQRTQRSRRNPRRPSQLIEWVTPSSVAAMVGSRLARRQLRLGVPFENAGMSLTGRCSDARRTTLKKIHLEFRVAPLPCEGLSPVGRLCCFFAVLATFRWETVPAPQGRRTKGTPPGDGESHAPKRCTSSAAIS